MKFDGEQVFSHGPVGHESDSKPYEYNDNAADSVLKSGKSIEKQSQKEGLQDLSSMEGAGDELPCCMMGEDSWISENFDCSMSLEDFTPDDEKKVRDFVAPITSGDASPKIKVFDKDSVFYMDKSVMEPEPPELIVCYKERTYHVVKDICVDEGLPSQDKFLFDTDVDEKSMCNYIPAGEDLKHDMVKEKCDLDNPISDVLKSSQEREIFDPDLLKKSAEEKGSKGDLSRDFYSKDSIPAGEARQSATFKFENDTPKEIFSLVDLLSMPVSGENNSYDKSSKSILDKEERLSLQRPSQNAVSVATGSSCERSGNGDSGATLVSSALISPAAELNYFHEEMLATPTLGSTSELEDHGPEEEFSATPAQISTREVSDRSHAMDSVSEKATETNAEELCSTSNVDARSISSDPDTSEPTSSGRQECHQNGGSDSPGTQNSSRVDDPRANSILTEQLQHMLGESSSHAAGLSQHHYGFGESSFSAAGPVSGLITYSGSITNSGSVSLRSDSSTTSTRSFAFPVLQSEWNTSPVRMAKGDRRRLRKHGGWKRGLLCCRF